MGLYHDGHHNITKLIVSLYEELFGVYHART